MSSKFMRRSKRERDLEREIQADLELEAEEQRENGLSEEEARYAARRVLGNRTLVKEEVREMWRWSSVEAFFQDVRYGLRQLRSNPGFTITALLTLALGVGANTAIFSIVNSVLLRPLPFQDPERLVQLFETETAPGHFPLSGPDYMDWQAQNHSMESTSLFSWRHAVSAASLDNTGQPEPAFLVRTQANFFTTLGVRPLLGRTFAQGEDAPGKNRIAVLSYRFWQQRFGGKPDAVGKTIKLNGETHVVAGVMPQWFNFPAATDLWGALDMSPKELGVRGNHNWSAIGRIRAGISLAQAREELRMISERLEKRFPDSNEHVYAVLMPLREQLVGGSQKPLLILFGAVTLVLLVACANVANLLLARATGRQREMALRASLGASRARIVRQLLTESVLLALSGAALGVAGAWWCVELLQSAKTIPIPRVNPIGIDGYVLAFTVAVSVLTGVLFGLVPALQTSRVNLVDELKAAAQAVVSPSGTRRRLRNALVVGEIAVTLALLTGAGLLLRTFDHLRRTNLGFDSRNIATVLIDLPETGYVEPEKRRAFFDQLIAGVGGIPGVQAAAAASEIPLEGGSNGYIRVEGNKDPKLAKQLVGWNYITPDYFRTLGIPLLRGRGFSGADVERTAAAAIRVKELYQAALRGAPQKPPADLTFVSVISQATARTFWPNQDAVGKVFFWNDAKVTVVGIAADVKEYGVRAEMMPQAYFPLTLALSFGGYGHLVVKTSGAPEAVLNAIRSRVRSLDGSLAVLRTRTMDEVIAANTQDTRLQVLLLGVFAALALVLAAVGLYGVMSYLVVQRTREIGIRIAVGAERGDVLRLVMKQGAILTGSGVLLGVLASLLLTRSMATLLYGVSANDPLTLVSVTSLLSIVGLAAYYIPARRATKVDPMLALRYE